MRFEPERVLARARLATTPDLLDRVTVLREGMEPAAVEIFAAELARRGVTPDDIASHEKAWKHRVLRDATGMPHACHVCGRAATAQQAGWHRMWGLIPLFQRTYHYCAEHEPAKAGEPPSPAA